MLENHGLIEQQPGTVRLGSPVLELTGSGEWQTHRNQLGGTGGTLINGAQHTIRGRGVVQFTNGVIVNDGVIVADGYGMVVNASMGLLLQNGTLKSEGASNLRLTLTQPVLHNHGEIIALGVEGISIDARTDLENMPGGEIVVGTSLGLLDRSVLTNHTGATLRGSGAIYRSGDVAPGEPSRLVNHGLVAPGMAEPGQAVGKLELRDDYVQSSSGVLEMDIIDFAPNQHDQLIVRPITSSRGGSATLAGTLALNFDPGFTPLAGDRVELIDAVEIIGQFETVTGLPELTEGLAWRVGYETHAFSPPSSPPNLVTLQVALAADFNLDGAVDAADYTLWRDTLGSTGLAAADANGDLVVDSLDFAIWRGQFGQMIASASTGASIPIPEPPGSLVALLLMAAALAPRKRPFHSISA